jgi:L-rhamnose-H+ transport protein
MIPPMAPQPALGVGLHVLGASAGATCYAPQKAVRRWSWETFWMTQAVWCWLVWPVLIAWLSVPQLWAVLCEASALRMLAAFAIGLVYGIGGGTAFNISIRYIGFALTYAVAIGLSSVIGTLAEKLYSGKIVEFVHQSNAGWIMAGMAVGILGIALCGVAGRLKELDLQSKTGTKGDFSLIKGLLLSLTAGVCAGMYGWAIDIAQPVVDIAKHYPTCLWQGSENNVALVFVNVGAFVSSFVYCLCLAKKNKSFGELVRLRPGPERASLPLNYLMALLTGTLWYGQFLLLTLGRNQMGEDYAFTSWGMQMILLVLISNLLGIAMREWKGCRGRTWTTLGLALLVLFASVLLIAYGNNLGSDSAATAPVVAE